MAQTAVALHVLQTLDIHANLGAQFTFDKVISINLFTDCHHLIIAELIYTRHFVNAQSGRNFFRLGIADAVNVSQSDVYALVSWDVYPSNTSHTWSPH